MRIDAIELHVGEPDFPYTQLRQLEAKSEARTVFSAAPTHDAVNAQLREMAARLGADAVIRIEYNKGISMSSWNSLKGTGVAVKRTDRAASNTVPMPAKPSPSTAPRSVRSAEPLRSSDNNHVGAIIAVIAGVLLLFSIMLGS